MKSRLMVVGLFLALTMGILIISSSMAQAAGCSLVTISGRSGAVPMALTIKAGDCVVFMNYTGSATATPSDEVKVLYKEGKSCAAATSSAVGFSMDENKCYATGWMTYGQTANLVFVTPGTYTYDVYFKGGGLPLTGQIVVKE